MHRAVTPICKSAAGHLEANAAMGRVLLARLQGTAIDPKDARAFLEVARRSGVKDLDAVAAELGLTDR